MAKVETPMRNEQFTRVTFADKVTIARLNKLALREGRTQQRQLGFLLDRFAALLDENPEKLAELGFIMGSTAKQLVA